ncbi:protein of unknown function [Candidatus Hydrogenisulfobacillus filiaventi]|uniref:Uncharacterized protein n=1 Tax=Candidatus Hydrogenisulfobacillus filiaventi TaxID=2707344 RepID=A0A6F8ZG24_9FIRM|nr:protein of unknown function [Candidatus Hydrogenisulfobacillus filiaventi]
MIGAAFDSSHFGRNMSEILAYGTAVVIEAEPGQSSPVRLV